MIHRTTRRLITAIAIIAALATVTACTSGGGTAPNESPTAVDYGLAVPGTITAAAPGGNPPFISNDATGKPVGLLVDLNEVITKRMGLNIVYKLTTVSAALPQLTAGQYDMIVASMAMSPEREQSMTFTAPFIWNEDVVVTAENATANKISDFDGKRLAAGLGSAQEDFAKKRLPKAQLVTVVTNAAGIDQLLNGNLYGMILASNQVTSVLAQNPGKLKAALTAPHDTPSAMGINKKLTVFQKAYGEQLATTIDDGTFLKLFHEYFPGDPYPTEMYKYWPSLKDQIAKENKK